nr:hypothetical protein [Actinomycetes bacterium]
SRADWIEQGSMDLREAAGVRAADILRDHYPTCIDPEIDRELRREFSILLEPDSVYAHFPS